jgi:putative nucleotidyltransferase with HDIG domain
MIASPERIATRDIRMEIARINEVVSFPPAVAEILHAMADQHVTMAKITDIIESDPALTAKVLGIANSPFYGLRRDVTNIAQALCMLGLDEIGHLLLTIQMKSRLMSLDPLQRVLLDRLWKHSVSAAVTARLIAARYRIPTEGKEYTAALLHDMGKLVMIQYFPALNAGIGQHIRTEGMEETEAELHAVGITHTQIGKQVGEKWRLPKEYLDAMQWHHQPWRSAEHSLLCAVVRWSDLLCEQWELGMGEEPITTVPDAQTRTLLTGYVPALAEADFERENEAMVESFSQHAGHTSALV